MMIWTFINGWQKTSRRQVSGVLIMLLISLSPVSNTGHASEEQPSMELLELLGQFEQQDEAWINNELGLNELGIENNPELKNESPSTDKQDSSEYINE